MPDTDSRIAALEEAVDKLRAELERARTPPRGSMRLTSRCSACGAAGVLYMPKVITHVQDPPGIIPRPIPLRVGIQHKPFLYGEPVGGAHVDAYACERCGHLEWNLREPPPVDGESVMRLEAVVDPAPSSGPFR
jgi:hypothetical protein